MTKEDKQLLIDLDKSHIITPSLRKLIERFKQLNAHTAQLAPVSVEDAWINVEDRLPEVHNEWILGYENGYKKAIPCSFNTKTKKFIDSDGFEITVNYWQPLPAPPLSHLEAKEGQG